MGEYGHEHSVLDREGHLLQVNIKQFLPLDI
jgi:hypothetical protein